MTLSESHPFRAVTPLLRSVSLSERCGRPVYLKMENMRPSGSFKCRGIGELLTREHQKGKREAVSSSGGNAGFATATVGKALGWKVTVVVPESTPEMMRNKISSVGATVHVHGANWNAADQLARQLCAEHGAVYVPPFDEPVLWEGHASLVTEVAHVRPALVVCAVGGGGLLGGVVTGCSKLPQKPLVVAAETCGAHSFNLAWMSGADGTGEPPALPAITSVAKSLGALAVSRGVLRMCRDYAAKPHDQSNSESHDPRVHSVVVSDSDAIRAVAAFLEEERCLVEPSCGAALACLYDETHRQSLLRLITATEPESNDYSEKAPIIVVVCGGHVYFSH
ncbi:MAG: hypothetical protein MHM6MM_002523 [Cercozoa sp. M6MM]